ncbi:MAG: hypothetical protein WCS73_01135 [Lentisphaeria bacterium]
MEILKKNLVLIVISFISLILSLFFILELMGDQSELAKIEEKTKKELAFFDKVKKSKIRLKPDSGVVVNVVQSQKNAENAKNEYQKLCDGLGKKYKIVPKIPSSSPEAIRWIRENLNDMTQFVIKNEMTVNNLGVEFNKIVQYGYLGKDEFFPVFRMLYIYRRVITILAESGVKEVSSISWPLVFATYSQDRYTVTPINIAITGDGATLQKFLNRMSSDTTMLFYLRDFTIVSSLQFTQIVNDRIALNAKDSEKNPQLNSGNRTNDMPGMMGFPTQNNSGMRGTDNNRNLGTMDQNLFSQETNDGKKNIETGREHWIKLSPKRQDYLAFEKGHIQLKVRFDLLEFKIVEEQAKE